MLDVYLTGTAGNSLSSRNGMTEFSTLGVDNDIWLYNCAQDRQAHLNGEYLRGRHQQGPSKAIHWYAFKGDEYSYKVAEMKVGPPKD